MAGRLIDAEALTAEMYKHHVHDDEELEPLVYLADAEKVIANAPTVDAIPVDWLQSCIKIAELFGDERNAGLLMNLINLWHRDGYGFFERREGQNNGRV